MNGLQIGSSAAVATLPSSWNALQTGQIGASLGGDGSNNALTGTVHNDTLNGLAGNDTLTGGTGNDQFVFNTALNATTNVDSITDFTANSDKLVLDHLIFTSLAAGSLGVGSFVSGVSPAAADANDFILYNTTTGAVSYDADANGAGVAIQFATLTASPTLTAADFAII